MRVTFLGSQEIGAACLREVVRRGDTIVGVGLAKPEAHETWTDDVEFVVKEYDLPAFPGHGGHPKPFFVEILKATNVQEVELIR